MVNITKPKPGARLNHAHPLSRGLVGWWLLNEGGGGSVYPITGRAPTGTLTNMDPVVAWVGSIHGGGVLFEGAGSSDEITIGNFLRNPPFSVVAWVYIIDDTGVFGRSYIAGQGSGSGEGWYFTVTDSQNLEVFISTDTATDLVRRTSINVYELERWYQFAFTWTGGLTALTDVKIYINDAEITGTVTAQNGTGSFVPATGFNFKFGNTNLNRPLDGIISDVKCYDRVLNLQEIQQLYYSPYANISRQRIIRNFVAASNIPKVMSSYRRRRAA